MFSFHREFLSLYETGLQWNVTVCSTHHIFQLENLVVRFCSSLLLLLYAVHKCLTDKAGEFMGYAPWYIRHVELVICLHYHVQGSCPLGIITDSTLCATLALALWKVYLWKVSFWHFGTNYSKIFTKQNVFFFNVKFFQMKFSHSF